MSGRRALPSVTVSVVRPDLSLKFEHSNCTGTALQLSTAPSLTGCCNVGANTALSVFLSLKLYNSRWLRRSAAADRSDPEVIGSITNTGTVIQCAAAVRRIVNVPTFTRHLVHGFPHHSTGIYVAFRLYIHTRFGGGDIPSSWILPRPNRHHQTLAFEVITNTHHH